MRRNGTSDMISVRIPLALHAMLMDYVKENNTTITAVTEEALEAFLRDAGKGDEE